MLEDILPMTYYSNMMGVAVDLRIIQTYLEVNEPKLYQRLEELNMDISIIML